MISYSQMQQGVFLSRPNRFVAEVRIAGRTQLCHVKNTGRCRELLVPGAAVWCQHHTEPARKTAWSLITVQKGDRLINLDSQVPNRLARQWVACGGLGFCPTALRPEVRFGDSRLDLYFERDGLPCYLEVKGVTLETDGVACFPDAPTVRGTRHLRELLRAAESGFGAYALFVIQLEKVRYLTPNWVTDPDFAQTLCACAAGGVQVLAVSCRVGTDTIAVQERVPLRLGNL